jgi:2'-5' RNA ligase
MSTTDRQSRNLRCGGANCEPPPRLAGPARVFVGIKLTPAIADELADMTKELERFRVRRVAANDMHLTLVPPWPESSIPTAIETLHRTVPGFGRFVLDIQHVGYGPDLRRPRMLWADCAVAGELAILRAALLAAYTQTDARPFRPHVTLARLRGNGRAIARKRPIDRAVAFRQWVDSIELFRSPPPGERDYRILASIPLSNGIQPAEPASRGP